MKSLALFLSLLAAFAFAQTTTKATDAKLKAGAAAAQAAFAADTAKTAPDVTAIRRKAYRDAETAEATWRQTKLAQLAQAKDPAARTTLLAEIESRWTAAQPALATFKAAADSAASSVSAASGK